jgi:drug/metabolite transporter (DMT)-like permease
MTGASKPAAWKILVAFAIIYLVWGSTFLAIRVGVREVPPFLFAAIRFLIAGTLLYAWVRASGAKPPTAREWKSVALIALLIFVFDYGLLFWAERRVPSGIAAVMMATIPLFTALFEIFLLGTQRLTTRLASALAIGVVGVAVLVSRTIHLGETPIDTAGAIALVIASASWSASSSLSRKLPLPASKPMSSAAQMLMGGAMLTAASFALGEFPGFHPRSVSTEAWAALAYLILAGSILGFTAYVWLLQHESPTRVATYAYVNPVVAVLVGYFFGAESIGTRTAFGTLLVLSSVIVITAKARKGSAAR